MKTPGQLLYEHKYPPTLSVVCVENIPFATAKDIFKVPNEAHIPWRFLTAKCKESWETSAIGHHLFTK